MCTKVRASFFVNDYRWLLSKLELFPISFNVFRVFYAQPNTFPSGVLFLTPTGEYNRQGRRNSGSGQGGGSKKVEGIGNLF